ncbi:16S rRNA (guanine(527)-N(7))-methyltransferase RsmG [Tengunoibacter tsumagoiensis]|uniref:Ribosomal RNA small subunit methyltransferase G n=1 Tax=Tengunoibacter tsumagoiensis TaxID=2014871 RepID=A0A402A1W8_9CHLR|nr:16S rRNA (guanine(527)-N(7))-methyltransferase RsmG [Tengunoibacter tsumagoiensis]GCE13056.1 ribosomal RNA small subunit methyltransferase G [Tengunoibacter tsumagoiensis]
MSEYLSLTFLKELHQLGLAQTVEEEARLSQAFLIYRQELLSWNEHTNLTAITDPEEVLQKHFLDSLSLLPALPDAELTLIDIGTGAGFPGLPLKIARPHWQVTLLEATGKKTKFLSHVIEKLHLSEITVIHGRAEEYAHKEAYRGKYDIVTARAVSALATLLESGAPFCRIGGRLILPKKGDLALELEQGKRTAGQVGARLITDLPVTLQGLADGRRILVWEQQKLSPATYPRSWANMTKKPLG